MNETLRREHERQQALMASLMALPAASSNPVSSLSSWLVAGSPQRAQRGLLAYQANAGASAERSLATAFPTVQALVGEESFASLARAFWHARPPRRGDLACFGDELPAFIASSEQLADVPYLADSARLDWLLACAERAADAVAEPATLGLLAEAEPSSLVIELMPGVAVLSSAYPVLSVWRAHQPDGDADQHRAAAGDALAAGRGEQAVVWRSGWRAKAQAVGGAEARWTCALLRGAPLAEALQEAGDSFGFEAWLLQALQHGWLLRARHIA